MYTTDREQNYRNYIIELIEIKVKQFALLEINHNKFCNVYVYIMNYMYEKSININIFQECKTVCLEKCIR